MKTHCPASKLSTDGRTGRQSYQKPFLLSKDVELRSSALKYISVHIIERKNAFEARTLTYDT